MNIEIDKRKLEEGVSWFPIFGCRDLEAKLFEMIIEMPITWTSVGRMNQVCRSWNTAVKNQFPEFEAFSKTLNDRWMLKFNPFLEYCIRKLGHLTSQQEISSHIERLKTPFPELLENQEYCRSLSLSKMITNVPSLNERETSCLKITKTLEIWKFQLQEKLLHFFLCSIRLIFNLICAAFICGIFIILYHFPVPSHSIVKMG